MHKRYHPAIVEWITETNRKYKVTVLLKNYDKVIYTDVNLWDIAWLMNKIYNEYPFIQRVTIHQPTKKVIYNGNGRGKRSNS